MQNFTVSIAEANFSVTLDAQATKIVEGTQEPIQEVLLNGTRLIRN